MTIHPLNLYLYRSQNMILKFYIYTPNILITIVVHNILGDPKMYGWFQFVGTAIILYNVLNQ